MVSRTWYPFFFHLLLGSWSSNRFFSFFLFFFFSFSFLFLSSYPFPSPSLSCPALPCPALSCPFLSLSLSLSLPFPLFFFFSFFSFFSLFFFFVPTAAAFQKGCQQQQQECSDSEELPEVGIHQAQGQGTAELQEEAKLGCGTFFLFFLPFFSSSFTKLHLVINSPARFVSLPLR